MFGRSSAPSGGEYQTDHGNVEGQGGGLDAEYGRLIRLTLERWGVGENCTSVEVHQIGTAADGRAIFVAAVRLCAWERRPALTLLLGLPLLERKIRKAVRGHWVADVSHFGGVWLHASDRLNDTTAAAELRQLLVTLTRPRAMGRAERREGQTRPIPLR